MTDVPPLLPDDLIHGATTTAATATSTTAAATTTMKGHTTTTAAANGPTATTSATTPSTTSTSTPTTTSTSSWDVEEQRQILNLHKQQQQILRQEESVLADILQELDRERHRRAEMEAKVRVLEEELQSERRKNTNENLSSKNGRSSKSSTSLRDFTRMQAERDGYREIVEALTQDRPAFSTAMMMESSSSSSSLSSTNKSRKNNKVGNKHNKTTNNNNNTQTTKTKQLPIHIVRLLEVMPWDPRAQSYVFGHEQVYEWQILGADHTQGWKKELQYFPTFFKTLPVIVPTNGQMIIQQQNLGGDGGSSSLMMLPSGLHGTASGGSGIAPPKRCVLTNLDSTVLLNIDNGYPLPEDGGDWMWISNWTVDKTNDTDEQGWSYSNDYQIMATSTYYNEFREPIKGQPAVARRRRKWRRRRMLCNYPHASTMTQEYLKLLSQKAILDVMTDKLSTQLVDTKMNLTTIEAERFAFEERTNRRIRQLETKLREKNQLLGIVGEEEEEDDSSAVDKKPPDQLAEIGSAVTQWVTNVAHRKQNEKKNTNDNNDDVKSGTTRTPPHSPKRSRSPSRRSPNNPRSHSPNPKQQFVDFFEKIKHNAGQEIDKFKQGLGGSGSSHQQQSHQQDNNTNNNKNGTGSDIDVNDLPTTKQTSSPPVAATNVYVPATKTKLKTSDYSSSTTTN